MSWESFWGVRWTNRLSPTENRKRSSDSRRINVVRLQVFSLRPVYDGSCGDSRRVSGCVCHYGGDSPCSQTGCRCWPRARRATPLHPECKKFTHTVRPQVLRAAMLGYCGFADVWQEPRVENKGFTSSSRGASDSLGDFLNIPLNTLPLSWWGKRVTKNFVFKFSLRDSFCFFNANMLGVVLWERCPQTESRYSPTDQVAATVCPGSQKQSKSLSTLTNRRDKFADFPWMFGPLSLLRLRLNIRTSALRVKRFSPLQVSWETFGESRWKNLLSPADIGIHAVSDHISDCGR